VPAICAWLRENKATGLNMGQTGIHQTLDKRNTRFKRKDFSLALQSILGTNIINNNDIIHDQFNSRCLYFIF
tara:strand:+ start:418 stop:633 length:216 start_codon:yes stop_codon:yes gene_type:complete